MSRIRDRDLFFASMFILTHLLTCCMHVWTKSKKIYKTDIFNLAKSVCGSISDVQSPNLCKLVESGGCRIKESVGKGDFMPLPFQWGLRLTGRRCSCGRMFSTASGGMSLRRFLSSVGLVSWCTVILNSVSCGYHLTICHLTTQPCTIWLCDRLMWYM